MMNSTYKILKEAGCSCGQTTDFRLKIQPGNNLLFDDFEILQASGGYVTKVKVTLIQGSSGPVVIKHLCDAPVVCTSDQHILTIDTVIIDGTTSEEDEDYRDADDG